MSPQGPNRGESALHAASSAEAAIARRVAQSRATIPHLELSAEFETDASLSAVQLTSRLVAACGRALREVPRANGAYRDGGFESYSRVNVAVALPAADAFVLATVFEADSRTNQEIAAELERLSERARGGTLTAPERSGATFTLWPPLAAPVRSVAPPVVPGQAAGLAAGAVRRTPVLRGEAIVPGHVMTITLACDHRILHMDGAGGLLGAIEKNFKIGE